MTRAANETTEIASLSLPSGVPEIVVVIDAEIIATAEALVRESATLPEVTVDTIPTIDEYANRCRALARRVEANRVAVKAAPLELCRAIDDAAKGVTAPLLAIEKTLTRKTADVQLAAKRASEEAERKRRAAEEDRIRRERELAEVAATATTPEDRAAVAELREEVKRETATAWVGALRSEPQDQPRSSVHVATIKGLEIFDPEAVPLEVNGIRCRTFDEAAIKRLLLANVPVPGARLIDVPSARRRGR